MRILIFGSGIVGQATGKGLVTWGHEVIFIDVQHSIIENLKSQGYRAFHIEQLGELTPEMVNHDVVMFCVSTPAREKEGGVNIDYIRSAIIDYSIWLKNRALSMEEANHIFYNKKRKDATQDKVLHRGKFPLVVIRSTVPPGTTRNKFLPLIEKYSNLKAGIDFGLCMQPEFLRARSSGYDFLHPRLTVIGEYNIRSGNILERMYSHLGVPIARVSLEEAEFMKYVHNCFNATKISFINEMWLLSQKLNVNPDVAFQLATLSAEGFWNPMYGTKGGQPFAGACLPKDTTGFLVFALEQGIDMPMLSSVIKINEVLKKMSEQRIANPALPCAPPHHTDNSLQNLVFAINGKKHETLSSEELIITQSKSDLKDPHIKRELK
jgi:UDPglucose 6-dehydrogenase